jgi:mycothiol synthase
VHVDSRRRLTGEDVAAVSGLLDGVTATDGAFPLSEQQWLDLTGGGGEGFVALLARESEGDDELAGYGQVTRVHDSWALEVVTGPRHRDPELRVDRAIVAAAVDAVAEAGGGLVRLWVSRPTAIHDEVATSAGLLPERDLLQMRRSLPVDGAVTLETRPFRPGIDDEAWLAVNNRAFAAHPEQGGWDLETLRRREAQDWFDPEGFLLHEADGRLAGFCWTKVHRAEDPPLGEIYVIAVDPDFGGRGLGRALTLAGLAHLASRGITVGMLYVDAANAAAVGLYEKLGFTVDHVNRAYEGVVVAR